MERRSAEARGEGAAAIRAMEQAPVCPAIRAMEQAQQFIAPGWLTTPGPHAVQQPYGSWVPWQSSQPSAAGFVAAFVAKRRKLASYVNGSAADGVASEAAAGSLRQLDDEVENAAMIQLQSQQLAAVPSLAGVSPPCMQYADWGPPPTAAFCDYLMALPAAEAREVHMCFREPNPGGRSPRPGYVPCAPAQPYMHGPAAPPADTLSLLDERAKLMARKSQTTLDDFERSFVDRRVRWIEVELRGGAQAAVSSRPSLERWLDHHGFRGVPRAAIINVADSVGDLLACSGDELKEDLKFHTWDSVSRTRLLQLLGKHAAPCSPQAPRSPRTARMQQQRSRNERLGEWHRHGAGSLARRPPVGAAHASDLGPRLPTNAAIASQVAAALTAAEEEILDLRSRLRVAEEATAVVVDSVARELMCPLALGLPIDPVLAEDGMVYERAFIERWVLQNGTSPLTRAAIGRRLLAARPVKNAIRALVEGGVASGALTEAWGDVLEVTGGAR